MLEVHNPERKSLVERIANLTGLDPNKLEAFKEAADRSINWSTLTFLYQGFLQGTNPKLGFSNLTTLITLYVSCAPSLLGGIATDLVNTDEAEDDSMLRKNLRKVATLTDLFADTSSNIGLLYQFAAAAISTWACTKKEIYNGNLQCIVSDGEFAGIVAAVVLIGAAEFLRPILAKSLKHQFEQVGLLATRETNWGKKIGLISAVAALNFFQLLASISAFPLAFIDKYDLKTANTQLIMAGVSAAITLPLTIMSVVPSLKDPVEEIMDSVGSLAWLFMIGRLVAVEAFSTGNLIAFAVFLTTVLLPAIAAYRRAPAEYNALETVADGAEAGECCPRVGACWAGIFSRNSGERRPLIAPVEGANPEGPSYVASIQ